MNKNFIFILILMLLFFGLLMVKLLDEHIYLKKICEKEAYTGDYSLYDDGHTLEDGYIKCCNTVYINHVSAKSCEIFPYESKD